LNVIIQKRNLNLCTWYAAEAVPKTKPVGKLVRLSEETSTTDAVKAKVIDGNVRARAKKRRRIKWLHAMLCYDFIAQVMICKCSIL